MKLSATKVEKTKGKDKDYKLVDGEGLFLLVKKSNGKSWRFNYRYAGKQKTLYIGMYPQISLSDARKHRDDAKQLLANGEDPAVQKQIEKHQQQEADKLTFECVALEWLAFMQGRWTADHYQDVERFLVKEVYPTIGSRPLAKIHTPELVAIVERLQAKGVLETAKRARQRISAVFNYGMAKGYCELNKALPLVGILQPPKVTHMPTIQPEQLATFIHTFNRYQANRLTKLAIELMLHTFPRANELAGAQWGEINWLGKKWTIPATRMKRNQIHTIPLSTQVLLILQELHELTGYQQWVFPHRSDPKQHMNPVSMLRVIKRMGYSGEMTVHGFRSLASTILNESGEFEPDLIESALAHEVGNSVRQAYNRTQFFKRRIPMMQWYSDYIEQARNIRVIERVG